MRNLFFTLFAVSVAAVAAMTATTAMLNTPVRKAPDAMVSALTQAEPSPPEQSGSAPASSDAPAAPAAPGNPPQAGAAADAQAAGSGEEEADKDPYEGIAAEELPPDLQYSADSSVSFPTNI